VVEEVDTGDFKSSADSWQYSTCLKWGYADSIKLVSAVAGQQDIPGLAVSRNLVGRGWQGAAGCPPVVLGTGASRSTLHGALLHSP
jgi:hypothetical protein